MCTQSIESTMVKLAHPKSDGRTHTPIDPCIASIVQALNDVGMQTIASCCGHGKQPGLISLEDGREVFIAPDYEAARKINNLFPPIN